jgi:hypothetical protein
VETPKRNPNNGFAFNWPPSRAVPRTMEERPIQCIARRARVATIGRQPFTTQEDDISLADQVRVWEQVELEKMEQKRQEQLRSSQDGHSGRHLDHLKRKGAEQEDCNRSAGSSHAVEGGNVAGLLNEDRGDQDRSQNVHVLLRTGERHPEFMSVEMSSTC